ncbi:hypothetical protein QBC35DRAFT_530302 [Podospora australis]|uniref:Protein FAF1 n=1 Tax=Podospora australis TaxID=1536484 RepID=A0AAN6WY41_9PEZI|nr:hypothetical protein QBC35DRAFT_530302 [Podospora australis]
MPSSLGKRKSRATDDSDAVEAQEALRRALEARFAPLGGGLAPAPPPPKKSATTASDEDDSEEDDEDYDSDASDETESDGWEGLDAEDEDDETPVVEVVDHTTSSTPAINTAIMSKKELKAYLSSRPPTAITAQPSTSKKSKKEPAEGEEDSAAFLANDLALQRLIAESHILSAAGGNASHWQSSAAASSAANTRAFAAGRTAKKTTDMRIQALGAKGSILDQAKMPMAMRKGIVSASAEREAKRRREAKENGIILEREQKKKPTTTTKKRGRGERPVDAPGVGRMRGAQLTISAREARMLSSSGGPKRGGRGGKRR